MALEAMGAWVGSEVFFTLRYTYGDCGVVPVWKYFYEFECSCVNGGCRSCWDKVRHQRRGTEESFGFEGGVPVPRHFLVL